MAVAGLLAGTGCSRGPDVTVASAPVQQGFRLLDGYKVQVDDGALRFVDRYRNEGGDVRSATFVFVLREDDGRVAWTGRATVRSIASGAEFEVEYEGSTAPPDGDQDTQWHVEDVAR